MGKLHEQRLITKEHILTYVATHTNLILLLKLALYITPVPY